jgi:hypothetical protein
MTRGQQDKPGKRKRARKQRQPLAAHPLFAPVLGLWGAALGGLVVLVLPPATAFAAAVSVGLGALGEIAPFALAALAALVLGTALFLLARTLRRKARRPINGPSLAALAVRHVQPIDPARELGSASLDEPVETMPFTEREPEPEVAATAASAAPEAQETPPPPRALDLSEFAELAGRNGVWVEEAAAGDESAPEAESVPQPEPAPVPRPSLVPPVSPTVVERLRAVPPSELSLVQMVERFAAALHEHQSSPVGRNGQRPDPAGREAALAEALRALAALSDTEKSAPQSEPLRAALTRLQELRGAA